MSQLVIEMDDPEDEALLLRLLPKLNGRVIERSMPEPESNESPVAILRRIAERGGLLRLVTLLSGSERSEAGTEF